MSSLFPNGLNGNAPMFGIVPPGTATKATTNAAGLTQTPVAMTAPAATSAPDDDTPAKRLALAQNTIVGSPVSGSDRLGGS